jgi:hypothetical protein
MNLYAKILQTIHQNSLSCLLVILLSLLPNYSVSAATFDGDGTSILDMQGIDLEQSVRFSESQIHMSINVYGQDYIFHLTENTTLLKNADLSLTLTELTPYAGKIDGLNHSWVRLTKVKGNYIGAFFDGTELFLVDLAAKAVEMTADTSLRESILSSGFTTVVFKASSIIELGQCGLDTGTESETFEYSNLLDDLNLDPADTAASATREIAVTIVADTEYVATSGGDIDGNILAQMNIVDGIFSDQLGLNMSVTNIVQLADNGSLTSTSASALIVDFRNYVASEIGNQGLTHLFTGKDLNGGTVGIAYLGGVCGSFGVGITQAGSMSSIASLVAAHEFGHNFGSPHDNQSGSSCEATPGTFLMNPFINGNDQFSDCSLSIIQPVVNSASCIVDVTPIDNTPPTITSVANLNATTNTAYQYDGNSQVEADGSTTITYELDFGPSGMTLSTDGFVTWTPSDAQQGANSVQITAINAFGTDTQTFDIEVAAPPDASYINFNEHPVSRYGGSQDVTGSVSIEDGGATLKLQGNRWQKSDFAYVVSADTILEFDFKSTAQGEVHGIGFDNNLSLNENKTFRLFGTQNYGFDAYQYSGSGNSEHFVIPVGEFFTGTMSNIFFAMDHDIESPTGDSYFSNIRVYEAGAMPIFTPPDITSSPILTATVGVPYQYDVDNTLSATGSEVITYNLDTGPDGMTVSSGGLVNWTPTASQEGNQSVTIIATNVAGNDTQSFSVTVSAAADESFLNFNDNPPLTYGGGQDVEGSIAIEDGGATLKLTGNLWKRVDLTYTLSIDTVLEFEFKSTVQGEVHGIGFDNNLFNNENRTFKLLGTQNYGRTNFTYTGSGEFQSFSIPVGAFYRGDINNIFFMMDHDIGSPNGNSYFKNIKIVD